VASEASEALKSARKEWDVEASRSIAAAVRKAERNAEAALDGEMAKHAAEMSALNSAFTVARELQAETKGLLEESEARLRDREEELAEAKQNRGIHGEQGKTLIVGLHRARVQLRQMKAQLSALRKECSAFSTRRAPQLAELAKVVAVWNQDTRWNEHDSSRDPSPNCSLDDPVIQHLLVNWTQDKQKLQLLRNWLKHVSLLALSISGLPLFSCTRTHCHYSYSTPQQNRFYPGKRSNKPDRFVLEWS